MRALLPNHLLHLSRSQARTLLVRFQACELSSSSSSPPHNSRDVRVSVWWDFKSCAVPDDMDASKVAPAIAQAVRANGIKGPIHINAFGDVSSLSKRQLQALASTGIQFTHFPHGSFLPSLLFSPSHLKLLTVPLFQLLASHTFFSFYWLTKICWSRSLDNGRSKV